MGRGEIENRDAEAGLGELPDDIALERGDLPQGEDSGLTPIGAPDAIQQTESARQGALADLGAPDIAYSVRSVYDSRPVNAYDFNIPVNLGEPGAAPADLSFIVPVGYICVLRRVITFIEPAPPFTLRAEVRLTLQRQGTDVVNNIAIPIGVAQDDLVNCFVLANEAEQITARFTYAGALLGTTIWAHFYGQMLLKLGRPLEFEIANPAPVGAVKTFSTRDILPAVRERERAPIMRRTAQVPLMQPAPKFRTKFRARR